MMKAARYRRTYCACVLIFAAIAIKNSVALNTSTLNDCGTDPIRIHVFEMAPYLYKTNATALTNVYASDPPLEGILFDLMERILSRCLRLCKTPPEVLWKTLNSSDVLMREILDASSGISYAFPISPVMMQTIDSSSIDGVKPPNVSSIVNPGGYYVIANRNSINRYALTAMLESLGESWPIFVLTFLLAGISGVLIWIMEVFVNKNEFPASFARGSYEGFWWAFISMTTVGYGDKTPRSLPGRLFGMVWILLGLVVIATYTATITNAFSSLSNPSFTFHDSKVAVIAGDGGSIRVTLQGGTPITYPSFADGYTAMEDGKVDAMFVEKLRGAYYMNKINNTDLRVMKTVSATLDYKIMQTTNFAFSTCFSDALATSSVNEFIKKYAPPGRVFQASVDSMNFFSVDSSACLNMMYYLGGILGGLIVIGTVAQLIYKTTHAKRKNRLDFHQHNGNKEALELREAVDLGVIDRKLQDLSCDIDKLREIILKSTQRAASTEQPPSC